MPDEQEDKIVGFRMDPNEYEAFKRKCYKDGTNVSAKLKQFISAEMNGNPGNPDGATPALTAEEPPMATRRLTDEQLEEILSGIMERMRRIEGALEDAGIPLPEPEAAESTEVAAEEDHLSRVTSKPKEEPAIKKIEEVPVDTDRVDGKQGKEDLLGWLGKLVRKEPGE